MFLAMLLQFMYKLYTQGTCIWVIKHRAM